MIVMFDVWSKFGADHNFSSEEEKIFESIYNYIYDRLVFMWDEIEKEEQDKTTQKAIMVYLLQNPKAIQPRGYSQKMCDRIIGCFNENDATLLWKSVERDLGSLLN